jgi:hypothetical protein
MGVATPIPTCHRPLQKVQRSTSLLSDLRPDAWGQVNACITLNGIIATQLMGPFKARGCLAPVSSAHTPRATALIHVKEIARSTHPYPLPPLTPSDPRAPPTVQPCPSDTVDLTSFDASGGPGRYRDYTLAVTGISVVSTLVFTPFLPRQKEQCREWGAEGEARGGSCLRGALVAAAALAVVGYSLLGAVSRFHVGGGVGEGGIHTPLLRVVRGRFSSSFPAQVSPGLGYRRIGEQWVCDIAGSVGRLLDLDRGRRLLTKSSANRQGGAWVWGPASSLPNDQTQKQVLKLCSRSTERRRLVSTSE